MAHTTTTYLGLVKPTPGTREPITVVDLNANADAIDAQAANAGLDSSKGTGRNSGAARYLTIANPTDASQQKPVAIEMQAQQNVANSAVGRIDVFNKFNGTEYHIVRLEMVASAADTGVFKVWTRNATTLIERFQVTDNGAVLIGSFNDDYGVATGGLSLQSSLYGWHATDAVSYQLIGLDATMKLAQIQRGLDVSGGGLRATGTPATPPNTAGSGPGQVYLYGQASATVLNIGAYKGNTPTWGVGRDADTTAVVAGHTKVATDLYLTNSWGSAYDLLLDTSGNVYARANLSVGGTLAHKGANLGFFNGSPTTKGAVTGSKGANAALASLLTILAAYGLVTDSST